MICTHDEVASLEQSELAEQGGCTHQQQVRQPLPMEECRRDAGCQRVVGSVDIDQFWQHGQA